MKRLRSETHSLDEIDARLLAALEQDARQPISELARLVGLSAPSVSERIRKLQESGIIRSFTVDIDTKALGYPIGAMVRVRPLPGKIHLVEKLIQEIPQFIECYKLTGEDAFFAHMLVRSVEEMDDVLESLVDHAMTYTAVIKTTPVKRRLPPL
ncbi:Lrp/AsnC family transcriptional regulator [Lacibacterium aquatile]|uniref:Lrp/AsnC family transcriptional regulator n=1 Tax=Lacibacterium aquatile TaxID=1168082 RepID=A0ABW5DJT9_9PROT